MLRREPAIEPTHTANSGSSSAAESYAEAEPCFFNAHALAPADARWSYYLAHVYRLQGESMKAAEFFERSLEDRPDDVAALIWLGNTYFDQGRLDEADAMFSRGLARQPDAAARFGRGRVALAKHDYARAIEHLEGALTLDRSATVIHYSLALAYRAAGDLEQAENHLRLRGDAEVRLTDPLIQELGELLHSEVVYERRGDRALARGEFTAAVTHFRKGLDLAPTSLSLRQKLAVALSVSGDLQAAGQELLEVLRRSPEFAPAHYSLGVLLLSNGREDLAIDRFMAAVRYDPTYLQARLQLANALRRRGRFQPALRQYAEVIKMDPRVPEARFGEVLALVRLKHYQEARNSSSKLCGFIPTGQSSLTRSRVCTRRPPTTGCATGNVHWRWHRNWSGDNEAPTSWKRWQWLLQRRVSMKRPRGRWGKRSPPHKNLAGSIWRGAWPVI